MDPSQGLFPTIKQSSKNLQIIKIGFCAKLGDLQSNMGGEFF
jgi:hypothetical protein